jgi:hypothetical protein
LCVALQELTGVGTINNPTVPKQPNWSPIHAWLVQRHNDAEALMRALHPLMSQKRQAQIERSFQQVGVQL